MSQADLYKKLPEGPGVYLMKDKRGRLLYVGKAGNLRRRVSSYFTRPHDDRIQKLVESIHRIEHRETETAIEALILEANLIKEHEPLFNIREKDDKSFLYVGISKEPFPRVLLVRGKDLESGEGEWRKMFGPFTAAGSLREAVRILRRIFPFSTHKPGERFLRPCFEAQIGLCPGVCTGAVSRADYLKNIKNLILFFEGQKRKVVANLKKEMKVASRALEYERAEKLRRQIFAFGHIQDVALIADSEVTAETFSSRPIRIEGYDISNISGTSAVGSMVVFVDGKAATSEYRKFKIQSAGGANDVGMMTEVLERRFRKTPPAGDWPLPQLILVDGGVPQVNAARRVLRRHRLQIPVIGLAKGPERKRNDVVGVVPEGFSVDTLISVRDEAHRFAIAYHKRLRAKGFLFS